MTVDVSKLPGFGEGGWFWLSQEGTEANRQIAEAQGQQADDIRADYVAVFQTPAGKRVLQDLIFRTISQPTWVSGVPDAVMAGCQREGQNSLVWYIFDKMQGRPSLEDFKPQPAFPTEKAQQNVKEAAAGQQPEPGNGDGERRRAEPAIPAGDRPARKRPGKRGGVGSVLDGSAKLEPTKPDRKPAGKRGRGKE